VLNSNGGAVIPIPIVASMVDTQRYYQAYFRDPADPLKVAVTSAIHVDFCE
jgi:hypothetical protein